MKHLHDKWNMKYKFLDSCTPGALGVELKLTKIDKFSKIFLSTTARLKKNNGDLEERGAY
jgi:hypothetical protein